MLFSKVKDQKKRVLFLKREKKLKIYKFLFINLLSKYKYYLVNNPELINPLPGLISLKKNLQKVSKTEIKSRCNISNRSNSVDKKIGLSRIQIREFAQFGLLGGYTKAVW